MSDAIAKMRSQIDIEGVRAARDTIAQALDRTPLIMHPLLVEALECEVYLKHENHLPTGAFKIRGGLNYMANASQEILERGVATATRGNHGQSIAMAAARHGTRCVIGVPLGNSPDKNDAMRAYGAEIIEHGKDFDEAREHVEEFAREEGMTWVHSANEPHLINGVGTYSLEILEDLPDVDVVVVPVGGGSAVCGAITVFRALKPDVQIIGVQAENAPSIYESWKQKRRVTTETANTFADGLATREPFELPLAIMLEELDDMVLVSEEEIRQAIRLIFRTTHNVAEGAGATPVAALSKIGERFVGKKVVAVLSGGNIDSASLCAVLSDGAGA